MVRRQEIVPSANSIHPVPELVDERAEAEIVAPAPRRVVVQSRRKHCTILPLPSQFTITCELQTNGRKPSVYRYVAADLPFRVEDAIVQSMSTDSTTRLYVVAALKIRKSILFQKEAVCSHRTWPKVHFGTISPALLAP